MNREHTIKELKDAVHDFCEERDWEQYHGAKDLAIGVITEASELLEHFRFRSDEECHALFDDPEKRESIEDEIADVFYFLLRLGGKYDIDLTHALHRKLKKNALKYPVDKAKGSNLKYDEL